MKSVAIAVAFLGLLPAAANAGSVDSAYNICALIDGTGLASEPCEVSGWSSSVDMRLDMSAGEARKLCGELSKLAAKEGWDFDPGWKLQIYSPYSGDKTIAYCSL